MSHKVIVATRSFGSTSQEPWDILREGGCEVVQLDVSNLTGEGLAHALVDADALIIGNHPVGADHIKASPRLKVISMHGVGVDHIDLEAARQHDIVVANCPGANANSVADLTFALMLAISRPIIEANAALKRGEWGRYPGVELWQKRLGLIGLGRIGHAVARRAHGFDMPVQVYDPFIAKQDLAGINVRSTTLETLLTTSDYVSLHAPLTDDTRNLINANTLRLMKPTAYLINTARGELVDEAELQSALKENVIAGAAVDVFVEEPPQDFTLVNLPSVVATPHIGAHSQESITHLSVLSAKNVVHTLQTGEPIYRVV